MDEIQTDLYFAFRNIWHRNNHRGPNREAFDSYPNQGEPIKGFLQLFIAAY